MHAERCTGLLKGPSEFVQHLDCSSSDTHIKESQNCRGWKGPPEIIESNAPAKAGEELLLFVFLPYLTHILHSVMMRETSLCYSF